MLAQSDRGRGNYYSGGSQLERGEELINHRRERTMLFTRNEL